MRVISSHETFITDFLTWAMWAECLSQLFSPKSLYELSHANFYSFASGRSWWLPHGKKYEWKVMRTVLFITYYPIKISHLRGYTCHKLFPMKVVWKGLMNGVLFTSKSLWVNISAKCMRPSSHQEWLSALMWQIFFKTAWTQKSNLFKAGLSHLSMSSYNQIHIRLVVVQQERANGRAKGGNWD